MSGARMRVAALALACFAVLSVTSYALAQRGGLGGSGLAGGCPTATATSPGCVRSTGDVSVSVTAANGLSGNGLAATPIAMAAAGAAAAGAVTTGAQTIAGQKTFSGDIVVAEYITASSGASPYLRLSSAAGSYLFYGSAALTVVSASANSNVEFQANAATGDALRVSSGGYARLSKLFAGAPTATDCDAAAESGRVAIDTTNLRWYFCDGVGWHSAADTQSTTCTLNGASPSVCTATVTAGSTCTCSNVGATAAIAANGCAVGLAGTTLTVTSANLASNVVNLHCEL